jgi:hypothetical protein
MDEEAKSLLGSMVVHWVPITTVTRWKENPKSSDLMLTNAKKLQYDLKTHGFRSPLIVWEKNRVVYKGNTTHLSAELSGMTHVPVVLSKFADETAAIAYALADNNASDRSEWNNQLLQRLMKGEALQSIGDEKKLMMLTGFDEKTFRTMLAHTGDALPDALPNVDIQGFVPGKVDFIILQFDTEAQLKDTKVRFGLTTDRGKVVKYADFIKSITWKVPGPQLSAVRSHVRVTGPIAKSAKIPKGE